MQTKRLSLIEAIVNTIVGFAISIAFTWVFLGSWAQSIIIVGTLTVVSVLRGYIIRRIFNQWR